MARGVSLAVVSRAPLASIEAYRKRMSWPHRWVSSANNTFNTDLGITTADEEWHGLSVFLRDGSDIFRIYLRASQPPSGAG